MLINLRDQNRVPPRSNLIETLRREEKIPSQIWGYVNSCYFDNCRPEDTSACSVTAYVWAIVGPSEERARPCWLPSSIHHVFCVTLLIITELPTLPPEKIQKTIPPDDMYPFWE